MSDDEPAWPSDVQNLQELFVDVTGKRTFTDPQDEGKGRGIVHATDARDSTPPEDVETNPEDVRGAVVDARPDAVEDAIDAGPNSTGR